MPSRVVSGVFTDATALHNALRSLQAAEVPGYRVYSPVSLGPEYEHLMPRRGVRSGAASPMRLWSLGAGLTGCFLGFWLAVGSAYLYDLYTGGKPSASWTAYCVIGFELTILTSALVTVGAVLWYSRLYPRGLPKGYAPGFSVDEFGVAVPCDEGRSAAIASLLKSAGATNVRDE